MHELRSAHDEKAKQKLHGVFNEALLLRLCKKEQKSI